LAPPVIGGQGPVYSARALGKAHLMSIRSRLCLALLGAAPACSDLPPPPIGQLRLGLSSGIGEGYYELSQASFAVEGAAELTLESDDQSSGDTLQRALPEGDYSVRLLEGWQLARVGPGNSVPVEAELASQNPLAFSILAGELTTVTFQFRTLDGSGDDSDPGGDGEVRIGIEVDGASSPQVLISELMKNPEVLPDADGEWIELYNAGTAPVDLGGCTLARDDQDLAFEGSLVLEAGAWLTLANGEAPGFVPDILYSGLTLPNTGSFVLRLACAEQVLDEVTVDAAVLTQRAGRSASLSGTALDDVSNDNLERWCEGATSYNGDFGTPGAANPSCGS
jgi:Lamin Tail Domain